MKRAVHTLSQFGGVMGALLLVASSACAEPNQIVINEIMYHPPGDLEDLQYIELHNAGNTACNLSKWQFSKGVKFVFLDGSELAPKAFAVVCRNRAAFTRHYGKSVPVAGEFGGHLSHNGERVELSDSSGKVIDAIKYADSNLWPLAADGLSSSLERICPFAPGEDASNWAASKLPEFVSPAGTPGRVNDSFSANPLPVVGEVTLTPAMPKAGEATVVEVDVSDADGVKTIDLAFQVVAPRKLSDERTIPMRRVSGVAQSGRYRAALPAQPDGCIVRYRIRVSDKTGARRTSPMANDLREAWSYSTYTNTNSTKVPFGFLLHQRNERNHPRQRYDGTPEQKRPRGQDTFIYMPAGGGIVQTFDFVQAPVRNGGYKVRFLKDQTLRGMTSVNIIFESSPRYALAESLSYDVYRLAGVPSELNEHIRMSINGEWLGYHLLIEQPNKSFLTRNKRDTNGNLYKLIWYGNGVVGMHEKKTNVTGNHDDLLAAIDGLKKTDPEAQWTFIKQNFNVDEFVNYYAVNMCILNWDGFFNNFFVYHDIDGSGLWEIYPWDEDKTWGDFDGASARYDWVDMPLTYGMTGSQRPGSLGGPTSEDSFSGWWRAPGFFSGPLLANPHFRQRFLARLREICTTIFTKEEILPLIDGMEERLAAEVPFRAKIQQQDAAGAVARFRSDLQSLRQQVNHRRKFILDELDKRK